MELRQILDLAPQLVAVFGLNLERLYANRVMLDYLGLSLEQWQQPFGRENYFHPDDSGPIDAFWRRAVARTSADELELRLRKNDGSYRWFLARFNPLRDEQGQITRWYVTGRTSKIESRLRILFAEKTSLSEKKSIRPRCSKRLLELREHCKLWYRAFPKLRQAILRS
jgi:PAS domain S-box-containing protein